MIICPICNSALKISKVDFEQVINGMVSNIQSGNVIGTAWHPAQAASRAAEDKYAGKTETQIAYLKQMEEFEQQKAGQ